MKITIVTGAFLPVPPGIGGAVERRWYGVAKELATRGYEVTMLGRRAETLPRDSVVDGVRIIRHTSYSQTGRLPVDLLKDLLYAVRLRRYLPPTDIIISNDFCFPLVRPPRKTEQLLVNVARVPKGQMRLYSSAHRFIVPSKAMAKALAQEGVADEKISLLANPIDTSIFIHSPHRCFSAPWHLLFAGRIHPEKGLELFIEAIRKLTEQHIAVEARIVGPYETSQGGGGRAYRDELRQQAYGLPISFLEPIFDRPLLAEQYRWAHFFVYPSIAEKGESFGVAPVEAMSTGAIPVVSTLECFDEFMDEACGERFDHRGAAPALALSRAILRAFEGDPSQRSLAASKSAQRFSYPVVTDKLLETITRLGGK